MGKGYQPITEDIYHYLLATSLRESPEQVALQDATDKLVEHARMMSTPDQAQFLSFLIQLMGAKRAIEVGVFTGYGSLAIAQALPDNGQLIACDVGKVWPAIGEPFWAQAGVANKIDLRIGPALDTLQQLIDAGESNQFDFVFIDADKIHYAEYFELCLQLVRPGGLIVLDNVLKIGDAVVHEPSNPATKSVFKLNESLHHDERVTISMIGVSQGMLLAIKR